MPSPRRLNASTLRFSDTMRNGLKRGVRSQSRAAFVQSGRSFPLVSSVWKPSRGLVFAEWAGSEDRTEMHRVGARWWLVDVAPSEYGQSCSGGHSAAATNSSHTAMR